MSTLRFFAFVSIAATASAALAQHAGDVNLEVINGRIVTSLADEITGDITPNVRVFAVEFGELAPNFTNEPGFDNLPGTFAFPSSIGFTIGGSLRRWNGVDFSVIPAEQVSIAFADVGPVLSPIVDAPVAGFSLTVGSNGEWHRHLEHTLNAPASTGIYLLQLTLHSTDPAVGESLPFWFVYNQNDTEANHDAAILWVTQHYAGPATLGCQPADIADDQGTPLPSAGSNTGVNEGDYNAFFQGFFDAASYCDIADDAGTTPPAGINSGVNEGDYNAFFQNFFNGCG